MIAMNIRFLDPTSLQLVFRTGETHLFPRRGLENYGPHESPSGENITIRFVYPKNYQTVVNKFKNVLESGGNRFPGFENVYRIPIELSDDIMLDHTEYRGIELPKKLAKAVEEDKEIANKPIYVIVVHPYPRWQKSSPYYVFKSHLLKFKIMSQMIRTDVLQGRNLDEVAYNVANAIFAKAGGKPWKLFTKIPSFSGTADLVIIIGFGLTRVPRDPAQRIFDRYAGYVIVMNEEGLMDHLKTFVTQYEKTVMRRKLIECIRDALNSALREHVENIDVIFHYSSKELSIEEEKSIKQLLEQISKDQSVKMNYAIIRIITHPLYRVFMDTDDGYPLMASYVEIGDRLLLIYTVGKLYEKITPLGVPRPILVSIRSSNIDIQEIDKEVFVYSVIGTARMNWRNTGIFNREPTTIRYARDIAYMVASFNEIVNLDPAYLPEEIPWFL